MSRDIEQYTVQESQADNVRRVTMAKIAFENSTIRVHDGVGTIRLENLLTQSEDFTHADWTEVNGTASANARTSPDGAITGDRFVENSTASVEHHVYQSFTATVGEQHALSVFVARAASGTRNVALRHYNDTDGELGGVIVDPDDSSIVSLTNGSATVTDIDGVWTHIKLVSDAPSALNSDRFVLSLMDGTTYSYNGNGASDMDFWGASVVKAGSYQGYYATTDAIKPKEEYIGIGSIGTVSTIKVSPDIRPIPVTLALSGIPNNVLYNALNENYHGNTIEIYSCFVDDNNKPLTTPALDWSGFFDVPEIEIGETTGTVVVHAESLFAQWNKANLRRYTDVDQQIAYAGDTFFRELPSMMELELEWGGKTISTGGGAVTPRDIEPRPSRNDSIQ